MKICPYCEAGYDDRLVTCPTHGGLLSEIRDLRPGMLIRGTYKIVRKLGKGGMGTVYLAEQVLLEELRALKFLDADLTEAAGFAARFLREVRTLRQIRNPHIVECGDPERAEDGSLFFSMEYVDGPSLHTLMESRTQPLEVSTALAIARGIAEGLGAAHAKGIVHRDIKPDNILLVRDGAGWVPKIVDFGIVATKETHLKTRTGNVLLTVAYAAPEQWSGTRAADLDGRTDLYALGAVLFEMLTGRGAFEAESVQEWAQKHLYAAAEAPSTLRPELAHWRGLDAMVLSLLAKDRDQRPRNVAALLAQMDAITYTPPVATPPPPPAPPVEEPAVPSSPAVEEASRSFPPLTAHKAPADNIPSEPQQKPVYTSGSQRQAGEPVLRDPKNASRGRAGYFWVILLLVVGGGYAVKHYYKPKAEFLTLTDQSDSILSLAFSPGGHTMASASHDNTIQFWEVSDGRPLNLLKDHVDAIAFSPDGRSLASADWDGNVKQWDTSSGQVLTTFEGHSAAVLCVAFSPDDKTLASGGRDQTIRIWDLTSERPLLILRGDDGDVRSLAYSPDGGMLAAGDSNGNVLLWDPVSGRVLKTLKNDTQAVNSIAFSPDGHLLAVGGDDATILLWDVANGKPLHTLQEHAGPVRSVAFSPDGSILASGSDDGTVKLWHSSGGAAFATLRGQKGSINSVAFSRDGATLATASADTTIRMWNMSTVHGE